MADLFVLTYKVKETEALVLVQKKKTGTKVFYHVLLLNQPFEPIFFDRFIFDENYTPHKKILSNNYMIRAIQVALIGHIENTESIK